jgi:hypothetical protein
MSKARKDAARPSFGVTRYRGVLTSRRGSCPGRRSTRWWNLTFRLWSNSAA